MVVKQCSNKSKYHNNSKYICNPESGRYVLRSGPVGKQLLNQEPPLNQNNKPCSVKSKYFSNPAYICNPHTGRFVHRDTPKGIEIVGEFGGEQPMIEFGGEQPMIKFGPHKKSCSSKSKYANNDAYGCNHATGRWIKMDTPHGRKIFKKAVQKVCGLIPAKNYSFNELVEIAVVCGVDLKGKQIQEGMLRELIIWNDRKKCGNDYTLLGDSVNDIPPNNIININGVCYDIDEVYGYINNNDLKNVDPYNNLLKLWNNEKELRYIVDHPGADPTLVQKYHDIIKEMEQKATGIFNNSNVATIINEIGIAGFVCVNDNPSSMANDPEAFKYSQTILSDLIALINSQPHVDKWLTIPTPSGISLGSVFGNMANSCVHGIGFKLLDIFAFLYSEAFKHGAVIPLCKLFKIYDGKELITFEISDRSNNSKGGINNQMTMNTVIHEITVNPNMSERTHVLINNINTKKSFMVALNKFKTDRFKVLDINYIDIKTCQDDTDYLYSQEKLSDCEDIISIVWEGKIHCFPRESIKNALLKSTPLFLSPSVRYTIGKLMVDLYPNLTVDENKNDMVDKVDEIFSKNINDMNDKEKLIYYIITYYRIYKWPLAPTVSVSYEGYLNLLDDDYTKYELTYNVTIPDVSSLSGHGVGAVHGQQKLYNIIPIGSTINKDNVSVITYKEDRPWIFLSLSGKKRFNDIIFQSNYVDICKDLEVSSDNVVIKIEQEKYSINISKIKEILKQDPVFYSDYITTVMNNIAIYLDVNILSIYDKLRNEVELSHYETVFYNISREYAMYKIKSDNTYLYFTYKSVVNIIKTNNNTLLYAFKKRQYVIIVAEDFYSIIHSKRINGKNYAWYLGKKLSHLKNYLKDSLIHKQHNHIITLLKL